MIGPLIGGLGVLGRILATNQFSPYSLAGLLAAYEADAITGLSNGAAVASWADSSGQGRTITQATGAKQPTWQAGVINGLPVVRFAGSQALASAVFAQGQAVTIYMVAVRSGGSGNQGAFDVASGSNHCEILARNTGPRWDLNAGLSWSPSGTRPLASSFDVVTAVANGASSSITAKNGTTASGNAGSNGLNGICLGNDVSQGSVGLVGDIAAVFVYSGTLAPADNTSIIGWLASKYGL